MSVSPSEYLLSPSPVGWRLGRLSPLSTFCSSVSRSVWAELWDGTIVCLLLASEKWKWMKSEFVVSSRLVSQFLFSSSESSVVNHITTKLYRLIDGDRERIFWQIFCFRAFLKLTKMRVVCCLYFRFLCLCWCTRKVRKSQCLAVWLSGGVWTRGWLRTVYTCTAGEGRGGWRVTQVWQ